MGVRNLFTLTYCLGRRHFAYAIASMSRDWCTVDLLLTITGASATCTAEVSAPGDTVR